MYGSRTRHRKRVPFPDPSRPIVVQDPTTLATACSRGGWMFVAGRAQTPAPLHQSRGRPSCLDATPRPVGSQHAAPAGLDPGAPKLARVGADLTRGIIFTGRPSDLVDLASCRSCVQWVSAVGPPSVTCSVAREVKSGRA